MAHTILNQVRTLLKMEIKLEQMKTDTDAVLEAEVFEAGAPVFIVNGEDRIPLPAGDYNLENGQVLSVVEDGIIASIGEAAEEVVPEEEQVMEEQAVAKKVVESTTKEVHFSDEQKATIKELVKEMIVELAGEVKDAPVVDKTEEKVEMSEVKPIKHSPEKNIKREVIKLNKNKPQTVEDRIAARLWG